MRCRTPGRDVARPVCRGGEYELRYQALLIGDSASVGYWHVSELHEEACHSYCVAQDGLVFPDRVQGEVNATFKALAPVGLEGINEQLDRH